MTRLIRELEEHGCLSRHPDEQDRRARRLGVTPAGETECVWFLAIEGQLAVEMFGGLAPRKRERISLAGET